MASNAQVLARSPIVEALTKVKGQIEARLPQGVDKERFFLGIVTLVQKSKANAAPGKSLADCDTTSLILAAYEAADIGCNLSPSLALGFLIPYNKEVQFQPSYRFFIQKAYDTGEVKSFFAEVVYAGDQFERQYAPKRNLFHAPGDGNERSKNTAVGAYALVEFTDGAIEFEYLTAEQINRHRAHSKQPDSLMWRVFWEEGWRKTPIRVIAKRLPLKSRKLEEVVEMINRDADRDLVLPVEEIAEPSVPRQRATAQTESGEPQQQQTQQAQPQEQSQTTPSKPTNPEPTQKQEPQPQKQNGGETTGTMFAGDEKDPFLTPAEIQDLWDKTFRAGWKKGPAAAFLKEKFKVDGPKDLRKSQLHSVLEALARGPE